MCGKNNVPRRGRRPVAIWRGGLSQPLKLKPYRKAAPGEKEAGKGKMSPRSSAGKTRPAKSPAASSKTETKARRCRQAHRSDQNGNTGLVCMQTKTESAARTVKVVRAGRGILPVRQERAFIVELSLPPYALMNTMSSRSMTVVRSVDAYFRHYLSIG